MKKVVIALCLTACSAAAMADSVPPFTIKCVESNMVSQPFSATWDGKQLLVGEEGLREELALSNAKSAITWWPTRISQKNLANVRLSFHGDSVYPLKEPMPAKERRLVTIRVTFDGPDHVYTAAIDSANVAGDIVGFASKTLGRQCVTTLRP
ncbi:hypothetical protein [Achromobacter sp. AGC39]